jgi:hypothetical protein
VRVTRGIGKKPTRPLWNPPELRVNVVNIDPPTYYPRAKPKLSKVQRVKEWLVGQNGILRRDLLARFKK